VEGASKRSIGRDYGVSARTLEKILAYAEPPGYRQKASRPKPVLGPFLGIIDEILMGDRDAPAKQRQPSPSIPVGWPRPMPTRSLVRFDRNDYSVPTDFAHPEVTVLGGTEEVRIVSGTVTLEPLTDW
jgi:hypothetical protein